MSALEATDETLDAQIKLELQAVDSPFFPATIGRVQALDTLRAAMDPSVPQ